MTCHGPGRSTADDLIEEGERRGKLRALRRVIGRQLELRFGTCPPDARERIACAELEELQLWLESFVTARSVDDVFRA